MMNIRTKIATLIAAGTLVVGLAGCTDSTQATEQPKVDVQASQPSAEPTPEETIAASTEPEMTPGQTNAVRKAEQYLNLTGFSQEGLKEQLIFEKFSEEDAAFAVENVETDWNENAFRKGEAYLDMTGMSRDGLIQQLEFEKFTPEQAAFAADKLGL